MSRLALIEETDLPTQPRSSKVLRRRRRRPLHPEQIATQLRDAAAARTSRLGPTPHGWLVIVYLDDVIGPNGYPRRIVRETVPDATLADARAILAAELREHGRRSAWIVAKSQHDQKTVRP